MKHLLTFESHIRTSDKLLDIDRVTGVFEDQIDFDIKIEDDDDRFMPDEKVLTNSFLKKDDVKIVFLSVTGKTSMYGGDFYFDLSDGTSATFYLHYPNHTSEKSVIIHYRKNGIVNCIAFEGTYFQDDVIAKFGSDFYMVVLKLLYYPTYDVNCNLKNFTLDRSKVTVDKNVKVLESLRRSDKLVNIDDLTGVFDETLEFEVTGDCAPENDNTFYNWFEKNGKKIRFEKVTGEFEDFLTNASFFTTDGFEYYLDYRHEAIRYRNNSADTRITCNIYQLKDEKQLQGYSIVPEYYMELLSNWSSGAYLLIIHFLFYKDYEIHTLKNGLFKHDYVNDYGFKDDKFKKLKISNIV